MATARPKAPTFPKPPADAKGPLEGYRILDMTRVLAGGFKSQVLAYI
jgi:crotonobetainyl-CoA:carnitine CoA-transferase CaiB-like acyl-CoA transferase